MHLCSRRLLYTYLAEAVARRQCHSLLPVPAPSQRVGDASPAVTRRGVLCARGLQRLPRGHLVVVRIVLMVLVDVAAAFENLGLGVMGTRMRWRCVRVEAGWLKRLPW